MLLGKYGFVPVALNPLVLSTPTALSHGIFISVNTVCQWSQVYVSSQNMELVVKMCPEVLDLRPGVLESSVADLHEVVQDLTMCGAVTGTISVDGAGQVTSFQPS